MQPKKLKSSKPNIFATKKTSAMQIRHIHIHKKHLKHGHRHAGNHEPMDAHKRNLSFVPNGTMTNELMPGGTFNDLEMVNNLRLNSSTSSKSNYEQSGPHQRSRRSFDKTGNTQMAELARKEVFTPQLTSSQEDIAFKAAKHGRIDIIDIDVHNTARMTKT